jgi:DNA-directed RNA polymerase III subunit RPC1
MKIRDAFILNSKLERFMRSGDDFMKVGKEWYLMQSVVTQYINSDTPGLPLQELGKKPVRSLCVRLKGKQGRFRQNLSGKRSNFTGRTVISPDPNLHPTQVIIPLHMSRILTISVPVTERSIEFLRECIENGSKKGGANFVIGADGSRTAVGYCKINLKIGDIVERHLRDDDVVIFNRQPSLHRISMMGFRAKISPGNTLRFNECVCTPFNADFDGDEMNIHVPQTL